MRMWLRNPWPESRASFAISFVTKLLKVNYPSQVAMLQHEGWGGGRTLPSAVSRCKQLSSASLICAFLPTLGVLLSLREGCWHWQLWTRLPWFPCRPDVGTPSPSWCEAGKGRWRRLPWRIHHELTADDSLSRFHGVSITPASRDV